MDLPRTPSATLSPPEAAADEPFPSWVEMSPPRTRVNVYRRHVEAGRVFVYSADHPAIYAEGADDDAALADLRAIAHEVRALYVERGERVPIGGVELEPGDELIASFVVNA